MLEKAIEACPAGLWNDDKYQNRFWHIAYHVLFYTDFYLTENEEMYCPAPQYIPEYQFLGNFPWQSDRKPNIGEPCSKEFLLGYIEHINSILGIQTEGVAMSDPSGFDWLPITKLELQFYNIRHIQHHTAQLIQMLRIEAGISIDWVGTG